MLRLWDEVNLGSVNHSKEKETNGRTLAGEVASPRDRSAAQRSALVERRRFLAQRPGPHGAPTAPHCQMARAFCGHGSGRLGGSAPPWTAQRVSAALQQRILGDAVRRKPPGGRSHWTSRLMARRHRVSFDTVQKIWRAAGLKPH